MASWQPDKKRVINEQMCFNAPHFEWQCHQGDLNVSFVEQFQKMQRLLLAQIEFQLRKCRAKFGQYARQKKRADGGNYAEPQFANERFATGRGEFGPTLRPRLLFGGRGV